MTENKSKNLKNENTKEQQAKIYTIDTLISKIKVIQKDKNGEKQKKNARYDADDIMLKKYITNDDTPYNKFKNKEYMYHICTILNSCCSTRMGAHRVYATALAFSDQGDTIKEMLEKESLLDDKDLEVIQNTLCQKISLKDKDSKDFRSYSFATKFLAFHSRYKYNSKNNCSLFPIYDSQVSTVIKKYGLNKIDTLEEFIIKSQNKIEQERQKILEKEKNDLDNYRTKHNLKRTIHLDEYPQFYRLMSIISIATELNLTDLDHIFWTLGDEIQKEEQKEKSESENKKQKIKS